MGPDSPRGQHEIDARGCRPSRRDRGATCFQEPGDGVEGAATGSRELQPAAARSFKTCTQSSQCVNARESIATRRPEASSITDSACGGLVQDRGEMARCRSGRIGFKAFTSTLGAAGFRDADDVTLLDAARSAGSLACAVHAEARVDAGVVGATHGPPARAFLDSRPVLASRAIQRALISQGKQRRASHSPCQMGRRRGVASEARARRGRVNRTCPPICSPERCRALGAWSMCAAAAIVRSSGRCGRASRDSGHLASDHSPTMTA